MNGPVESGRIGEHRFGLDANGVADSRRDIVIFLAAVRVLDALVDGSGEVVGDRAQDVAGAGRTAADLEPRQVRDGQQHRQRPAAALDGHALLATLPELGHMLC